MNVSNSNRVPVPAVKEPEVVALVKVVQPSPVLITQQKNLCDPDEVIRANPKLLALFSIGRLAVKLGREAYFGQKLMSQ